MLLLVVVVCVDDVVVAVVVIVVVAGVVVPVAGVIVVVCVAVVDVFGISRRYQSISARPERLLSLKDSEVIARTYSDARAVYGSCMRYVLCHQPSTTMTNRMLGAAFYMASNWLLGLVV